MRQQFVVKSAPEPTWREWTALAVCLLLFFIPIGQDSIWQVYAGQMMLQGSQLYVDILEPNPPLLFWLGAIQAIVAKLIGARLAVILFCLVLIAAALWLTPARYRLPALVAATILPLADFGKAEHYTLITTIPYAFLIAARMTGDEVRHPWAVGFLAALGFAMKPWFVLVPLAFEFFVKPRIRPENLALAISAVAYAASVPIFAPAFLADMVPRVIETYGSFKGSTYPTIALLAFLMLALGLTRRKLSPVGIALATAAVAFLPAVFIQAKWWPYQSIPARGFLFLCVATELMRLRTRLAPDALLAVAALLCFYPFGTYRNEFKAETDRHLHGIQRGASIAILSTNPGLAWPAVDEHGLKWQLSGPCLWELPASFAKPAVAVRIKEQLARDLHENPDVLILDRRRHVATRIKALLPNDYLNAYELRLRTERMESYVKLR